MTNVADRLRKLRDAAARLVDQVRRGGAIDDHGHQITDLKALRETEEALAEMPDPDVVPRDWYLDSQTELYAATEQRDALADALRKISNLKHRPGCPPVPGHDVAPGGHECSCPQAWADAALAKLEES
jgi:hypothetical protein